MYGIRTYYTKIPFDFDCDALSCSEVMPLENVKKKQWKYFVLVDI